MEDCEEPHMADDQEHHKRMEEASSFSMWSMCRISLNPGCPDQCCSPSIVTSIESELHVALMQPFQL